MLCPLDAQYFIFEVRNLNRNTSLLVPLLSSPETRNTCLLQWGRAVKLISHTAVTFSYDLPVQSSIFKGGNLLNNLREKKKCHNSELTT